MNTFRQSLTSISCTIQSTGHENQTPTTQISITTRRLAVVAGTYTCDFAVEHRNGDTSECDLTKPLECHHRIIEFSVQNSVDLSCLRKTTLEFQVCQ